MHAQGKNIMVKGSLKYETPTPLEHMWWTENIRNTLDVVTLVLSTLECKAYTGVNKIF